MISFNESISSNINGYNIDIRRQQEITLDLEVIYQKDFHFQIGLLELAGLKKLVL